MAHCGLSATRGRLANEPAKLSGPMARTKKDNRISQIAATMNDGMGSRPIRSFFQKKRADHPSVPAQALSGIETTLISTVLQNLIT